jgi:hypothetical protein
MARNQFPTKEQITQLRNQYPHGTRVELQKMDDPQAPPIGTFGTVIGVDDIGSVMVAWDNGCHLNVAYGEDDIRRLPALNDKVKEQILAIRDTGLTNMFDKAAVQRFAFERGYCELVDFIESNPKAYTSFIMTGSME